MELNELLQLRRSVRSYQAGKTVERSVIKEIIEGALMAPSWRNSETGRYYVVDTQERFSEALKNCLPEFNQMSSGNASALIVTTFVKDIAGYVDGKPVNELGNEWGAYDLGLQNAYLILKARDLGLDTLIMGIRDEKALRRLLKIPDNEEVAAVIALGFGDGDVKLNPRKNLEDVVKFC